jgi:hypothetical protein
MVQSSFSLRSVFAIQGTGCVDENIYNWVGIAAFKKKKRQLVMPAAAKKSRYRHFKSSPSEKLRTG